MLEKESEKCIRWPLWLSHTLFDKFPHKSMHNSADLAVSAKPLPPSSLPERNGMAHSYAAEYLPISRLLPDPKCKREGTVHPASRVHRCKFFSDVQCLSDIMTITLWQNRPKLHPMTVPKFHFITLELSPCDYLFAVSRGSHNIR